MGGVVLVGVGSDLVTGGLDTVVPAVLAPVILVDVVLNLADLSVAVLAAVGRGPMVVDRGAVAPVAAGRVSAEDAPIPKPSVHPPPK